MHTDSGLLTNNLSTLGSKLHVLSEMHPRIKHRMPQGLVFLTLQVC